MTHTILFFIAPLLVCAEGLIADTETSANPIVPGQTTDPSLLHGAAGLGQKALLAKKFAKAKYVHTAVSLKQNHSYTQLVWG